MPQPSSIDLTAPFDPTGYTSITGAQLLQLVDGTVPYIDKGFIVWTTDTAGVPNVPNASVTTKWQTYIWCRVTSTSVIPYVWNPNATSDVVYLQWQAITTASIGVGEVVGTMIATSSIDDTKMISMAYSKLIGAPSSLPPSGAAGGDLTGNYPNPSVAASAITGTKIATGLSGNGITGGTNGNINAKSIYPASDVAPSGTGLAFLRTNTGATACEWAVADILASNLAVSGNALKIPRVNANGTAYELVAPSAVGSRILQQVETFDNTGDSTANTNANTVLPTTSTCKLPTGLTVAITPLSSVSTLMVELCMYLMPNSGNASVIAALFKDSGTNCIAAAMSEMANTAHVTPVILRYSAVSGSTSATTFKSGFTGSAGATYNSTDGSTKLFGGTLGIKSYIRVTEYL